MAALMRAMQPASDYLLQPGLTPGTWGFCCSGAAGAQGSVPGCDSGLMLLRSLLDGTDAACLLLRRLETSDRCSHAHLTL